MSIDKTVNVQRNIRGELKAENRYLIEGNSYLKIRTAKSINGLLYTTARAVEVEVCEGYVSETFLAFSGFSKTLAQNKVRCTEKAVREQQAEALKQVEALLAEAKEFYAKEAA